MPFRPPQVTSSWTTVFYWVQLSHTFFCLYTLEWAGTNLSTYDQGIQTKTGMQWTLSEKLRIYSNGLWGHIYWKAQPIIGRFVIVSCYSRSSFRNFNINAWLSLKMLLNENNGVRTDLYPAELTYTSSKCTFVQLVNEYALNIWKIILYL